jgi:hypothetical protein
LKGVDIKHLRRLPVPGEYLQLQASFANFLIRIFDNECTGVSYIRIIAWVVTVIQHLMEA